MPGQLESGAPTRGGVFDWDKYRFMNIGASGPRAAVDLELDCAGGLTSAGSREDNHAAEPFMALALDLPAGIQFGVASLAIFEK